MGRSKPWCYNPAAMEHLERRRKAAAAAWNLDREIVLVAAGEPVLLPGYGDQAYPFHPHAEYHYLAERERPGSVLAFDPEEGWVDFVPVVTEAERLWTGGTLADEGVPADGLEDWLARRAGRPVAVLGSPLPDVEGDSELAERLRETLTHVRRPKDEVEIERLHRAAAATAAGYERVRPFIRPGLTERQVQIELEAEFFRAGARRTAYATIVGSGPNSAVLHFTPSDRVIGEGELVLIDAGAAIEGYACDVTRTYAASGELTPEQRDLYAAVLEAQVAAIGRCRAGAEWRDIHLAAAVDLVRGLIDMGLLRGNPESLVERSAHRLFFPHGLGHLVGLGVRDASGRYPGRPKDERPQLENLRCDLPLEPGYVITVEPGLYFIPAILNDPERRETYRDDVAWERVDGMLDFGGVRIEDNVLITAGEPVNLTAAIPK